jgi:hypothetical protein
MDVTHIVPDVVRAAGRFPPAFHVQHLNLLLKHPDATIVTYKKKTDETLETSI